MFPSLIEIGSRTAEKNSAQTDKQTDRQTDKQADTTKIMVTWPWTNRWIGLQLESKELYGHNKHILTRTKILLQSSECVEIRISRKF